MTTTKFFTRDALIAANDVAIATNRNRTMYPGVLRALDPAMRFPVAFSMMHNDVEMRVQVVMNYEGHTAWLDIPFDTYHALPEA